MRKPLLPAALITLSGLIVFAPLLQARVPEGYGDAEGKGCAGSACVSGPCSSVNAAQVPKSGIALGGIGAGFAELRADGVFRNWQIFNNRPLGVADPPPFDPASMLFFTVRYREPGREPRVKLLQVPDRETYGGIENYAPVYIYPWMTGVAKIESAFRFPFAKLKYMDPDMPFDVELEASSPFIPNDVANSSLPVLFLDFRVLPKPGRSAEVTFMASFRNAAGYETPDRLYRGSVEEKPWGKVATAACTEMDTSLSSWGSLSLASLTPGTTHYLGWGHIHPYYEIVLRNSALPNLDDTDGRNGTDRATGRRRAMYPCWSTLAVTRNLAAADTFAPSFVFAWHFPNRYNEPRTKIEGNYYSNTLHSSSKAAEYAVRNRASLVGRSRAFTDGLYATTVDRFVLDQINSHLNTFVTSGWLDRAGHFGILEGMFTDRSCCGVATVDVSVYGAVPVSALFPDLQRATMRSHRDLQKRNGLVLHSLYKNFDPASMNDSEVTDRLDLPAQYALLVLRDAFAADDDAYLAEMWPSVKNALRHVLVERDRDGDGQPDMEGIMSSYDNFPMYGLASYIQTQWLAALSAAAEAARRLGDAPSEIKYRSLARTGRKLLEERLWNGRYYRLSHAASGPHAGPDEGCLTDQLIGQWLCRLMGMEGVADTARVRTALRNILRMSYRKDFGLRNCSWPSDTLWHGVDRDIWVDQANTCWSGVELAFASFLLYEGMYTEAMDVIRTVDERYRKEGLYFNHQECGGHYYRAMSSWAVLNGMLGLSKFRETLSFSPCLPQEDHTVFFALPGGTAHYVCRGGGRALELRVLSGSVDFRALSVPAGGFGGVTPKVKVRLAAAKDRDGTDAGLSSPDGTKNLNRPGSGIQESVKADVKASKGRLTVRFAKKMILTEGQVLTVE